MGKGNRMTYLTEGEFKSIYSKVPRFCVELLVRIDEGFLLTLRSISPYKGRWHIPGGTVKYKETIFEALKRIAKEELGIEVEIRKLLGFAEYISEEKERGWGWPISMIFLCTVKSGTLTGSYQAEEIKAFREIPQNIVPEQKIFLQEKMSEILAI